MNLFAPFAAMAVTAGLIIVIGGGCRSATIEEISTRHVTGPEADLPADPGDVPPESELFARGR